MEEGESEWERDGEGERDYKIDDWRVEGKELEIGNG